MSWGGKENMRSDVNKLTDSMQKKVGRADTVWERREQHFNYSMNAK